MIFMRRIEIKTYGRNKINNLLIKFSIYFQTMKNKLIKLNHKCLAKTFKL